MARHNIASDNCPGCGSENWIDLGDFNDMTVVDTDAIRCWNCKHVFWVEGAEDFAKTVGTTIDDAVIDDGRKRP